MNHSSGKQREGSKQGLVFLRVLPDALRWKHGAHEITRLPVTKKKGGWRLRWSLPIFPKLRSEPSGIYGTGNSVAKMGLLFLQVVLL